jgi:RimJ/RimL family protein N-acetyltransferase
MLEGEIVGLRAIEPDDLESLRGWRNRPELRRYFREHRELCHANQEAWYERVLADHRTFMFAIVDLRDGSPLVGAAGICYIDWLRRSGELSLYVGAGGVYIDDRLAPDALGVLLRYGFGELGLHRLWTEVYDFDESKARLYESVGFSLEGRHRDNHFADGRWHDSLFYGILAAEYASTNATATDDSP